MGRTSSQKTAALPEERRARVAARAAALIEEEMSLQDLRKALDLTQVRMAELLGVRQDTVSRVEQRTDMLLSTLRKHIEAMGGELELTARFANRPPVRIRSFGQIAARD